MSQLTSRLFWADTMERAISTAAQAILLVTGLSESAIGVINQDVTWALIGSAAVGGFFLSVLKALAALGLTQGNSASLVVDNVKQKS